MFYRKHGLAGRYQLVLAIEARGSMRETASLTNVSVATAHRWWRRWQEAGADERSSLSCLLARSEPADA